MKRRHFLLGAGAALAGAWLARPDPRGGPHDDWFGRLNRDLRAAGVGRPVLVIDRARLARNCRRLMAGMAPDRHYRIVAKSLPSVPLIREVMAHTGSRRVMAFHQPFINALAEALPDCHILLGKPMPVAAVARFYDVLPADSRFAPARQLEWLVDSVARLGQYLALAQARDLQLRINIEIDVGLHRGGLATPAELDPLLTLIGQHPDRLRFAGFMGYDAHVGKLPAFIEGREDSLRRAQRSYQAFIDRLAQRFPDQYHDDLTFNGAGSPTILLHGRESPLNDLAAGSALLKPSDFDLPPLADFEPAAFIAAPVLKSLPGLALPGPLPLGRAWGAWDPNRRHTWFIYGGNWLAHPHSPAGLAANGLYGTSSNQMMLNGDGGQALGVDDFVFFRPTQSEAVLTGFGDLAALGPDGSLDWWPALAAGPGA